MAQKVILVEATIGTDLLENEPLTGLADSYDVTSVSGFTTKDNQNMCLVTLSERLEVPVFLPATSTFEDSVDVTLYCPTEGATIHYTTDGSTPTAESTAFTTDITLEATATVKAISVKNGESSRVVSKTYTKES